MKLIRRILIPAVLALTLMSAAPAGAQPPSEQTGEFVPAETLPQREQMPAAPLLIGAYAFVVLALFGYVISVSRRIGAVRTDIARLEAEIRRSGR
jgi:hypothetical protein